MKFILLLSTLSILVSCTPTQTVEGETTSGNINAYAPYMWSSSALPRDLKISTAFSAAEAANITAMSTAWETALENKKNLFNHSGTTTEVDRANLNLDSLGDDSVNGVYKIQHWPLELPSSALAVTQIFGRRFNIGEADEYVRIEHADILVNDNLYDFRTSTDGSHNTYDLQTVLVHEMGHFLGLAHRSYGSDSIMVPAIGSSTVARAPTVLDTWDVADRYNVTLGSSSQKVLSLSSQKYIPKFGDAGKPMKMLIELHVNGECVHRENGVVIQRHSVK